MKKYIVLSVLTSALCLISTGASAAGGHGNHGGGNKSGGGCKTTIINHFIPKHLSVVKPNSEFSFWVRGIKDASHIKVTAKNIPVEMTVEDKKTFFALKGNLPDSLSKTAARIKVAVHSPKCPAEKGILLKISD